MLWKVVKYNSGLNFMHALAKVWKCASYLICMNNLPSNNYLISQIIGNSQTLSYFNKDERGESQTITFNNEDVKKLFYGNFHKVSPGVVLV